MGIAPYLAETIVREHKFRPIAGDVLLLGRQTMQFSPEHAADMIKAQGLVPAPLAPGDDAIDRRTWAAQRQRYVRDDAFFQMLGAGRVRALDHTDYEGAELVHDLNTPIPDALVGVADFVLDGSTLDNLFSPAAGLQNMTRLLRPGGRFLSVNGGTAHNCPYAIPTGFWFLDYCAVNRFADCRVYLIIHDRRRSNVFSLDPLDPNGPAVVTSHVLAIVAFGEKGIDTTWDRVPVQRQYAGSSLSEIYLEQGRIFARSARPDLIRSVGGSTLVPSVTAWASDYYRTRWDPAFRFDRVSRDGQRKRSPLAAAVVRRLRQLFNPGPTQPGR
jgi:SAM-dependent methyltransferase